MRTTNTRFSMVANRSDLGLGSSLTTTSAHRQSTTPTTTIKLKPRNGMKEDWLEEMNNMIVVNGWGDILKMRNPPTLMQLQQKFPDHEEATYKEMMCATRIWFDELNTEFKVDG